MSRDPRAARVACAAVFFLNGATFASFAPHIPQVQRELDLSAGALGLALLGLSAGLVLAQVGGARIALRAGSRPAVAAGIVVAGAALALPALAPSALALAGALLVLGAGLGACDVAMNVQGTTIQARYGRPILSGLHAAFSAGTLAGAANGALAVAAGLDAALHLGLTGAVVALAGLAASRLLLPGAADALRGRPALARPPRRLAAVAAIGFCAALVEGAAADWSAVYMRSGLDAGAGVAGAAFVAFAATHAAVRVAGDRLTARFGPVALTRAGGLLAAGGLGVALAIGEPAAAIAGFALLGAGIATAFPLVISSAGRDERLPPAVAIAGVSTAAYVGLLAGPPVIGLLAEASTLAWALALLVALCGVVAALAPALRGPRR